MYRNIDSLFQRATVLNCINKTYFEVHHFDQKIKIIHKGHRTRKSNNDNLVKVMVHEVLLIYFRERKIVITS